MKVLLAVAALFLAAPAMAAAGQMPNGGGQPPGCGPSGNHAAEMLSRPELDASLTVKYGCSAVRWCPPHWRGKGGDQGDGIIPARRSKDLPGPQDPQDRQDRQDPRSYRTRRFHRRAGPAGWADRPYWGDWASRARSVGALVTRPRARAGSRSRSTAFRRSSRSRPRPAA